MTPVKLILENFEEVWKMQRKNGKALEMARLLCQKLVEAAPELQLEAEFPLLPTTPAAVELPRSPQEELEWEIEKMRLDNERLRRAKILKYGTPEEKEALKASAPDGLTVQEIAELYSVSVGTIRNYMDDLTSIGFRYSGEAGRMPIVYSKESAAKLAVERGWIEKTNAVQVEMIQQKLDQQQGAAPEKEVKDEV